MNHELIAQVLDESADMLEKHGHCKGQLWDTNGRHCAMGAIIGARNNLNLYDVTENEVASVICDALNLNIHWQSYNSPLGYDRETEEGDRPSWQSNTAVVIWNNAEERTAQEVVDGFRKSAKLARIRADGNDF